MDQKDNNTVREHVLAMLQVFETYIEDINTESLLKEIEKSDKRLLDNNDSTYFEDYQYLETPSLLKLKSIIKTKTEKIMKSALTYDNIWIHKIPSRGNTALHNHAPSFCSFCYYPYFIEKQGELKFVLFWNGAITERHIVPKKNMLLIFPGDVFHYTGKNDTEKIRYSIGGNFFKQDSL